VARTGKVWGIGKARGVLTRGNEKKLSQENGWIKGERLAGLGLQKGKRGFHYFEQSTRPHQITIWGEGGPEAGQYLRSSQVKKKGGFGAQKLTWGRGISPEEKKGGGGGRVLWKKDEVFQKVTSKKTSPKESGEGCRAQTVSSRTGKSATEGREENRI